MVKQVQDIVNRAKHLNSEVGKLIIELYANRAAVRDELRAANNELAECRKAGNPKEPSDDVKTLFSLAETANDAGKDIMDP